MKQVLKNSFILLKFIEIKHIPILFTQTKDLVYTYMSLIHCNLCLPPYLVP